MSAVSLDEGQRPGCARRGQRDGHSIGIRVAPELRQPVDELEGRICQSARERLLQLGWTRVAAKLHQEIADRGTRKPCPQVPGEEKHRRHAQQGERDPADFVLSRSSDGQHDGCRDQRHQRKAETGDEELEREPDRTARRPPARDERDDGREADDADCSALSTKRDVTVEARHLAQQPHEIESEVDGVTRDDDDAIEPTDEPSARIGEEDVDEHQGRQQKERLADHVEHRGIRLRQPRKRGNKARGDHQGTESALRPPGPRDQSAAHISHDDPSNESRVDVGEGAVLAGQAQLVRANGCDASGEGQGDDDIAARRRPTLPRFCDERWCGTDGRGDSNLPLRMLRRYPASEPVSVKPAP